MARFDKKTLLGGLFYGFMLLLACIVQREIFGMDKISGTVLFWIALFSTFFSALKWYFAYDKTYKSSEFYSDRIPRLVYDPHVNALVINVYKWFLILPTIGILTL